MVSVVGRQRARARKGRILRRRHRRRHVVRGWEVLLGERARAGGLVARVVVVVGVGLFVILLFYTTKSAMVPAPILGKG
jgi:hypothetical protein